MIVPINMLFNYLRFHAAGVRIFNAVIIVSVIIMEIFAILGYRKAKTTYESMKNENKRDT